MDANTQNAQPQQYNLKWTNHTYNMLQTFSEQLSKENFVDCTIACEGQFLKVHKIILSGCSHYFQQLFDTYKEPNPLIIMNDVKLLNLRQIVEFMYRGEVKIMEEELESLLALAETFKVKGLSNVRNKQIAKNSENDASNLNNAKKRKLSTDNDSDTETTKKEIEDEQQTTERTTTIPEQSIMTILNPQIQNIEQKIDKRPRILKRSEPIKTQPAATSTPLTSVAVEETENMKGIEISKIPRPPNAFMIFANEWRRKIAEEHPGENNKNISVHLGNMWKRLEKKDKDKYYIAAQKADKDHKTKYPGYYYSPKEARIRKELKTNQNKLKKPILAGHFLLLSSGEDEAQPSDIIDVSN